MIEALTPAIGWFVVVATVIEVAAWVAIAYFIRKYTPDWGSGE